MAKKPTTPPPDTTTKAYIAPETMDITATAATRKEVTSDWKKRHAEVVRPFKEYNSLFEDCKSWEGFPEWDPGKELIPQLRHKIPTKVGRVGRNEASGYSANPNLGMEMIQFKPFDFLEPYTAVVSTLPDPHNYHRLSFRGTRLDVRYWQNRNIQKTGYSFISELWADNYSELTHEECAYFNTALSTYAFWEGLCSGLLPKAGFLYRMNEEFLNERKLYNIIQKSLTNHVGPNPTEAVVHQLFVPLSNYFTETGNLMAQDPIYAIQREPDMEMTWDKVVRTARKQRLEEAVKNETWVLNKRVSNKFGKYSCEQFTEDLIEWAGNMKNVLAKIDHTENRLNTAAWMFQVAFHELDRNYYPEDVQQHALYDTVKDDISLFTMIMSRRDFGSIALSASGTERVETLKLLQDAINDKRFKIFSLQEIASVLSVRHIHTPSTGAKEGVLVAAHYQRERKHQSFQQVDVVSSSPKTSKATLVRLNELSAETSTIQALDGEVFQIESVNSMVELMEDHLQHVVYDVSEMKRFKAVTLMSEPFLYHILGHLMANETVFYWPPLLPPYSDDDGKAVASPDAEGKTIDPKMDLRSKLQNAYDLHERAVTAELSLRMVENKARLSAALGDKSPEAPVFFAHRIHVEPVEYVKAFIPPTGDVWTFDPRVVAFHSPLDKDATSALIAPPDTLYKLQKGTLFHSDTKNLPLTTNIRNWKAKVDKIPVFTLTADGKVNPDKQEVSFEGNLKDMMFPHGMEICAVAQEASNYQNAIDWKLFYYSISKEFCKYAVQRSPTEKVTVEGDDLLIQVRHVERAMRTAVNKIFDFSTQRSSALMLRYIMNQLIANKQLHADYRNIFARSQTILHLRGAMVMFHMGMFRQLPPAVMNEILHMAEKEGYLRDLLRTAAAELTV